MRFIVGLLILLTIGFADLIETSAGFADEPTKASPPTIVWAGNSSPGVQVKVDKRKETVTVAVNKDGNQVPKSIGITFFDADGNATALELKATEPRPDAETSGGGPTHFAGAVGPAAQSFVGFEIQIPFGSESPTIVRSEDLRGNE